MYIRPMCYDIINRRGDKQMKKKGQKEYFGIIKVFDPTANSKFD